MKPAALIQSLRKGAKLKAGYLFLGAEPFYRNRCRQAVQAAALGEAPDETALVTIDLRERPLTALINEARTQSLFAADRLVIGRNAELALPRVVGAAAKAAAKPLREYFADPAPGTVILLEAVRYDAQDREERQKLERVGKFFADVPERIELEALTGAEAQYIGKVLAQRMGLSIAPPVLAELVEMLGADAFRLENELQKLALYAGKGSGITSDDLETLVPEARQSGLFEFSEALGARDRKRALGVLDTMSRAGMYWPMQLTLLASLLRQALAAKELGASGSRQIATALGAAGFRIWPSRAQQLEGVAARFGVGELRAALVAVFEADRGLRSSRPDDRIVMELLVMKLTR